MMMKLVGFVAETIGNEDNLVIADAIIRIDGKEFVAPKPDWKTDDLRPLVASQRNFVHWLDSSEHREIAEGNFVWVAGSGFVAVLSTDYVTEMRRQIAAWSVYTRGIRWRIGNRTNFRQFQIQVGNNIEDAFFKLLRTGGSVDSIRSLTKVYENLPLPPTLERNAWLGLIYLEIGPFRSYNNTARTAMRDGLVQSTEEFDKLVQRRRNLIKQKPIIEVASSVEVLPSNDGDTTIAIISKLPTYGNLKPNIRALDPALPKSIFGSRKWREVPKTSVVEIIHNYDAKNQDPLRGLFR
ncbi:hypothetical protein PV772_17105 [Pseudarthrobacter sp. CC12]|uniref:hypothetical protein n=1 Tax=Pseudarthrobacter sp. CC12 TaxID=3029193 RepID=UPI0032652F97